MKAAFFFVPVALAPFVVVVACSSSSSPGQAKDGGAADTGGPDTASTGDPFAVDSGPPVDSAGAQSAHCQNLNDVVTAKAGAAAACDPSAPAGNECGGAVDGPCCKLVVSIGNTAAVNDYQVAVAAYLHDCTPYCPIPCGLTPPNNACTGSGHTGTCN